MLGMPSISWPRIDYEALGDSVGAAIRQTVGDAWNIETPHFQLYKTSYRTVTETHHEPEAFRMEIDNLKLVHKGLFPQESAIKGRVNKMRFNSLFKPLEKTCDGVLPPSEAANPDEYRPDRAQMDAIRLKIYQAVHDMFGDADTLNGLFDLTIHSEGFEQRVAVLVVTLYVRFYAHRRRIGPRESRRQKLGDFTVPMYWQVLVLGFEAKSQSASRPFPDEMGLVDQVVDFAAQMELHVRRVSFARMVEDGVSPEVKGVGELAIQAGRDFGLLDERGQLVDFPG